MSHSAPSRFRTLLPALALLALPAHAAAQTAPPATPPPVEASAPAPANVVFTGRVLDRATGRPVAGARVEFPAEGLSARTDSAGAFRLPELSAGHHSLVVAARGFRTVVETVALSEGMPRVDIPLATADVDSAGRVAFAGRVLDDRDGRPLADARVEFVSAGPPVSTDSTGSFRVAAVETGTQMIRVRARGYPTRAWVVEVEPGMAPATIRLQPDVVMLEGLRVISDRLERRRRAVGYSSRVVEGSVLANSSAPDMKAFVRQHLGVVETSCGGIRSLGQGCVLSRGIRTVASVIIDDVPQFAGIDALHMYNPSEMERVEVYRGGSVIYMYTTDFIERQAKRKTRWLPMPL